MLRAVRASYGCRFRITGPKPQMNPLDCFDVASLLDEDAKLVRDSVARFVDREVLPVIARAFTEHRFPAELVPGLADLGLLGATLERFGGVSKLCYGLICQELERGDSSVRSFVSVQSSLVMGCIDAFASDEQKDRWLPAMARGESIGCFGLTESQGGSDPANMRTHAKRDGDDWLIDGSKIWITNGSLSDVAIVWARTEEGIAGFLVERGTPGFEARAIEDKFSLRASDTAELFFDGVRVSDAARLPGARGLKAPLSCLNQARFGICFGALGAAQACLAEALSFAQARELFGRRLAETQLVQTRLADMARRITTAQLMTLRLAELADAGRLASAQISLAKWNNVRMALDVARDCRDLLGAAGITAEHAAMRHMLNLETVKTYEGTESIHALVVGKALTGHAAF